MNPVRSRQKEYDQKIFEEIDQEGTKWYPGEHINELDSQNE